MPYLEEGEEGPPAISVPGSSISASGIAPRHRPTGHSLFWIMCGVVFWLQEQGMHIVSTELQ